VGRGDPEDYVVERRQLRSVVEGAQWQVNWAPTGATVEDLGSTNGSVLVRRRHRASVDLAFAAIASRQAPLNAEAVLRLGWDGCVVHSAPREIWDGDVLVNIYGHFVYCTTSG
jgi:pSer/pThr/pTyr-binding forkhead associated (FHA) protein